MAPKKRLLLVDNPPTASSSSDDEQPADKVIDEEDSSEEEGDEEIGSSSEEEENQTQQTPSKPVSKNPPPFTPISNAKPAESESGSESGTESDSESEQEHERTPPPNPKVKPIASKLMKAQTQAPSTLVPAKSGTKRAAENNTGNDSKRDKKKTTATGGGSDDLNETEEDVKMTGEDSKKSSQRLFSEEDELKILKGLADFTAKTGMDPMKETTAFHSFVKKSMKAEVNGEQLKRKVRSLKKKFESSENFTKPHDKQAFELFKKVWDRNAYNEAEENGKANEKTAKSAKKEATIKNRGSAAIRDDGSAAIRDGGSAKKELAIVTTKESGKVEGGFDNSVILSELVKFDDAVGMAALNKDAVKRGLELMGESNRVALEKKWKKQQIAEMELFLNRAELIRDHSRLVMQEFKKTSSD